MFRYFPEALVVDDALSAHIPVSLFYACNKSKFTFFSAKFFFISYI
ncbi:hypothetical protein PSPO_a0193 [Pseudoalteromonas spongiae UST010723-006]|nr:hypothetical protein PSPO_a0193 [Pseudoalteromonas spongiae UST010723-006]